MIGSTLHERTRTTGSTTATTVQRAHTLINVLDPHNYNGLSNR